MAQRLCRAAVLTALRCAFPGRRWGRAVALTGALAALGLLLLDMVLLDRSVVRGLLAIKTAGLSTLTFKAVADGRDPKVVCYYNSMASERKGQAAFLPGHLDPYLCTHIFYAFATIEKGLLSPLHRSDVTAVGGEGRYAQVVALKRANPVLKVLLSVGGWEMGAITFSKMAASHQSRDRFIKHAMGFLRKFGFDGLDLDWEYPGSRGSPAQDRERFLFLLEEARVSFTREATERNRTQLLLTAAVGCGRTVVDTAYYPGEMARNLDFISLMSYDFHGSWDKVTGFNSALYAGKAETGQLATTNQDWVVRYWLSKGVPAHKLILGVALYGRSFRLRDQTRSGVGAPVSGPGDVSSFVGESGILSYYEICDRIQRGWSVTWDNGHKVPFATGGNQWVGYDNAHSVRLKALYARRHLLGGIMVWAPDLDDFSGTFCQQGTFPLLRALVIALNR